MKRTFIALKIDPGEKLTRVISEIKADLSGERIKWEDLNKLHLTLVFIGDTSDGTISDVSGILSDLCSKTAVIRITIAGIGLFKSIHDPRVLWAGIDNYDQLLFLQEKIAEGVTSLGIILEDRPFRPHLTLGRIKRPGNKALLEDMIRKYRGVVFREAIIEEIIYFESILNPEGSVYLPVKVFKMGPGKD